MAREIPQHASSPIREAINQLSRLYSLNEPLADPLAIILWENIGYLIDDNRRQSLFEEFRARVGFDASAIARAPEGLLLDIAKRGGMHPAKRVERWQRIAEIVLSQCGGDLAAHLCALPASQARAFLKRFPSIGDPGADKILLFSALDARASVDSNGLRVLVRLGTVPDRKSYTATYRAASTVLADAARGSRDWLVSAYIRLRAHGQSLCKRTTPRCIACPLDKTCAHVRAAWF
jgi:endonuclease-3